MIAAIAITIVVVIIITALVCRARKHDKSEWTAEEILRREG